MTRPSPTDSIDLYHADETAWLVATAELIRQGRLDEVDADNLVEYLEDLARRDRREVISRLRTLITHLLKWRYQPSYRTRSWQATIENQRLELAELLESGVLLNHASDVLPKAYSQSVRQAAMETSLPEATFPMDCPYTLDDVLASELD